MKAWFFVTVVLTLLLDQLSKWWVLWVLLPGQSVAIVPGILHFTLAFNAGIAFGLFPALGGLFLWVSLVVVAVVLTYYLRLPSPSRWTTATAGLLVGGALGNVWDRLRLGHVVDFIDFQVFPVFNLADTAITCATLLWVLRLWLLVNFTGDEQAEVQDG